MNESKAVEGLCQGLLVTVTLVVFPINWYWTMMLPVIFPCVTTLLALRELPRPPRWWFILLGLSLSQPAGLGWLAILLAVWMSEHLGSNFVSVETVLGSLPTCDILLFAGLQAWLLAHSRQADGIPLFQSKTGYSPT